MPPTSAVTQAPTGCPIAICLECHIDPDAYPSRITQGVPAVLDLLRALGLPVQQVRVEQRGLGLGCLDALERALTVPVTGLER